MSDVETRLADIERRVARMLQTGVIVDADYDAARVRVAVAGANGERRVTPWVPWATGRAGGDVDWWAPEIGEQVDLHCPNGEMPGARVVPAYYSDQVPAPAGSPDIRLIRFANGTEIRHDRAENTLSIDTPGTVDLTAGGHTRVQAPSATVDSPQTTFTGAVTVQGPFAYQAGMTGKPGDGGPAAQIAGALVATDDVSAGGVSLKSHTHPGDSGGTTGGPN